MVSLFPACIALALPLHCGWDGQFKGNAMGIKAHKIDEEMNHKLTHHD